MEGVAGEIYAVLEQAKASPAVRAELNKIGRAIPVAGTAQGWSEF